MAEVLITLTIIGVIAAITIPNLMQSYRKHQVEVGVKEAYSIINNALTMSVTENGPLHELLPQTSQDRMATKEFIYNYFLPYLKVQKDCGMHNVYSGRDGQGSKCLPFYSNAINGRSIVGLDGISTYGFGDLVYIHRIVLQNGMIFGIVPNAGYATTFIVDINGLKGPNISGHDIFAFTIYNSEKVDPRVYANWPIGKKGILFGGWSGYGPAITYWNNNNCQGFGEYCTTVIMKNGWKIPDDYPVKKW